MIFCLFVCLLLQNFLMVVKFDTIQDQGLELMSERNLP